jgi:CheY-like chemotaxis protein
MKRESDEALLIALSALLRDCVILLVEDDPHVAAATQLLLEELGAHVCLVHNGAVALEHLDHATPDLILSDLVMPRLDGYGLIRELRSRPTTHAIPTLAVSGLTDVDRERLWAAGFDACLAKPFDCAALRDALQAVMGRRPALLRHQCERLRRLAVQQRRDADTVRGRASAAVQRSRAARRSA